MSEEAQTQSGGGGRRRGRSGNKEEKTLPTIDPSSSVARVACTGSRYSGTSTPGVRPTTALLAFTAR